MKSCNFFSTEPILKKSDVVSRWESNSFISAVLVGQSKIRVPPHDHLWTINFIISKIRVSALTPIVGCYPKRRPLSHYPTSKIRFIKIHNNTRAIWILGNCPGGNCSVTERAKRYFSAQTSSGKFNQWQPEGFQNGFVIIRCAPWIHHILPTSSGRPRVARRRERLDPLMFPFPGRFTHYSSGLKNHSKVTVPLKGRVVSGWNDSGQRGKRATWVLGGTLLWQSRYREWVEMFFRPFSFDR